jgi:hypothetical protein
MRNFLAGKESAFASAACSSTGGSQGRWQREVDVLYGNPSSIFKQLFLSDFSCVRNCKISRAAQKKGARMQMQRE